MVISFASVSPIYHIYASRRFNALAFLTEPIGNTTVEREYQGCAAWLGPNPCRGICGCVVFSFVTAIDLLATGCFIIRVNKCSEDRGR